MILGEGSLLLFLDFLLQITYLVVIGGLNTETTSNGMELVVDEKKPYFHDENVRWTDRGQKNGQPLQQVTQATEVWTSKESASAFSDFVLSELNLVY